MNIPRHTKSRQAVLRAVKLSPQAITAEQILKQVRLWSSNASQATVYRNLDFLNTRGEIYRVEGQDGVQRYIGHTFHEIKFRCQRCGEVYEQSSKPLQEFIKRQMRGKQEVFFSRLMAQGLCASCLRELGRNHSGATRHPSLVRRGK